jgi:phage gp45-like
MVDRNSIKLGKVTKNTNDAEKFPTFQISYLGKVSDAAILLPYGLTSRPMPDDTLCLVFSIQGQEENRIAVPLGTTNRKKGLKDGETVLENSDTGAFLYLDEDGNLRVNIPKDLIQIVESVSVTASGSIAISATGAAALTASGLTITAPTVVLSGSLQVGTGFGCNGKSPQTPATITAAGGGNNTVVINQIRAALIANGIAV